MPHFRYWHKKIFSHLIARLQQKFHSQMTTNSRAAFQILWISVFPFLKMSVGAGEIIQQTLVLHQGISPSITYSSLNPARVIPEHKARLLSPKKDVPPPLKKTILPNFSCLSHCSLSLWTYNHSTLLPTHPYSAQTHFLPLLFFSETNISQHLFSTWILLIPSFCLSCLHNHSPLLQSNFSAPTTQGSSNAGYTEKLSQTSSTQ